jgi:hypothetical protein
MHIPRAHLALLVMTGFAAISAIGGGIGLILFNGMGIPLAYLRSTPFTSYVVPGLILVLVVGGSAFAALLALLLRNRWASLLAFAAGAVMTGWIIVEVLLIHQFSWLQLVYLVTGLSLMGLVVVDRWDALRPSHIPIARHPAH